jgi:hypothetical protein
MDGSLAPAPFVVGVGRSGTTLLRLMLDAHPELAIPPETHFLPALVALFSDNGTPSSDELVGAVETHPGWRDFGMDEAELRVVFGSPKEPGAADSIRAFYSAYAGRHGKERWGDKTPVYIESIAEIGAALGDQARFIHLIRDGRDVAVSRRARAAKRGRAPTPAAKEAATWKRRIKGARTQAKSVAHYEEIRYEDLIADPEGTLRKVCASIELEFDPGMLDYHRDAAKRLGELSDLPGKGGKVRPSSERVAAHALTSKPPTRERIERWRTDLDPRDITEYEAVAGDLLAELGYPLSEA